MNTAKHTPGPHNMDNLAHRPALPYAIVADVEHHIEEGEIPIRALVKYTQCKHAIGKPWCPERMAIVESDEEFILQALNSHEAMYEALQAIVQACASRTYKEVLHTAEGKKLFLAYEQSCKALAQAEGK